MTVEHKLIMTSPEHRAASLTTSSLHTQEDEIFLLHEEIRAVENSITQLHKTRAALLQRLNYVQSATRNLAAEVLSLILQHARGPLNFDPRDPAFYRCLFHPRTPFILSQVSYLWRQVAWSTPQLWTFLTASPRNQKQLESLRGVLKVFQTNVSHAPLTFHLDKPWTSQDNDHLINALFCEESGKKIHTLRLELPDHFWSDYFPECLHHLANVKDLRISAGAFSSNNEFSFSGLTSLQKLSVRNFRAPIKLLSSTLTMLNLSGVSTVTCIGLLTQCANLVILRGSFIFCDCSGGHDTNSSPIVLSCLQDFSWDHLAEEYSQCLFNFLRRLQLPALRALHWEDFTRDPLPFSSVFCANLNYLTTLSLSYPRRRSQTPSDIEATVKTLPLVEHLTLSHFGKTLATTFLQKLAWATNQQYVPALRSLTITECFTHEPDHGWRTFNIDLYSIAGQDLSNFLKPRFEEGVCSSFRLVLQCVPVVWGPTALEEIRELVKSGYDLEVTDGIGLDWLDPVNGEGEDEDKESEDEDEDDDSGESDEDNSDDGEYIDDEEPESGNEDE